MSGFRLYWRLIGASIRAQMQYRASFWMHSVAHLVDTGLEFLAIWALFARFRQVLGWTLPEVAFFYGTINIAFSIADAFNRGFDLFGQKVRSGDFDLILIRPRSTALQIAAQELRLMRVGRLSQSCVVFGWASWKLNVLWSPEWCLLLLWTLLGTVALFYALFVLQATLAFWTTETLEVVNAVTYGGVEAGQYPIALYRPWLREFLTYGVPIACVNYYPILALLGKPDPLGAPLWVGWLSPLAGMAFLGVALFAWELGVRHYRSTGS
ncbi:MAG: ABC transporter permease [Candidatus Poribacteria bacterium]|nr:MAG: ABC transporter permease [Candidatus Poribacteria bacterium]